MKKEIVREILETMRKDPGNWKGPFYFNRKDSRIIVPKLIPAMGYTLNFAHPYSYIGMGILMAFIIVFGIIFN